MVIVSTITFVMLVKNYNKIAGSVVKLIKLHRSSAAATCTAT